MRKLVIQWFPGHMDKARRMLAEEVKNVDIVLEVLDARLPRASSNPLLSGIIAGKRRLLVLNKIDLADEVITEQWLSYYARSGLTSVGLSSVRGGGMKRLTAALREMALPVREKWRARGVNNKSVRLMVAGIPNVGKSSLINRFLHSAKALVQDKPATTRGKQWLKIDDTLELLDTPGILWPKLDDEWNAFALAVSGAVRDEVFDREAAVLALLDFLREYYPDKLLKRYKNTFSSSDNSEAVLSAIAEQKGCLRSGGLLDLKAAAGLLLREFRDGKLGGITLDRTGEG